MGCISIVYISIISLIIKYMNNLYIFFTVMQEIKSILPDYGDIDIKLYDFTEQIYDFLNRDIPDEIYRLKKLDQLGLISEVYEGTHHSKWEYILIQLFLSQLLKQNEKATGLGSNVSLKSKKQISQIDLINSWSLLLNIGHLHRTLSCERYWFNKIIDNQNIQKFLLEKLQKKFLINPLITYSPKK